MPKELQEIITFDDVVIIPSKSIVEPNEVSINSQIGGIKLSIPLMSAPMDMVTNDNMAMHLAKAGALGVVHRNTPIEDQISMVENVKKKDTRSLEEEYLQTQPSKGPTIIRVDGQELYIIPEKDSDYWLNRLKGVHRLIHLGVKPTIAPDGKLAVGAAISPFDEERILKLDKIADILVLDVAHAHNENVINAVKRVSRKISKPLVVGNIGTYQAAEEYITRVNNIAGFRAGISSGSICTTGEVTGAASPTLYAVLQVSKALETYGLQNQIPIIADGGIRGAADAAKAIIAGSSLVMAGRYLASAEESASPTIIVGGKPYKLYRGMASYSAMKARHAVDRYSRKSKNIPEGVEGLVPVTGSIYSLLANFAETLKTSLGYAGAAKIQDAWQKSRLGKISPQGKSEVKPHDLLL